MLAEKSPAANGLQKDDAYTCGLIHDVGKMILLDSQSDRFAESLRLAKSRSLPLAKAEGEVFGFNHAHVGGLLAQRWKLAPHVQAAVTYHHSPATNPEDWARGFLVKAANTIAHQAAAKAGPYRGDVCDSDSMLALQLTPEQMATILAAVRETGLS